MATPNNTTVAQNTVQYDLSGVEDPTVVATEASPGSTYRLLINGAPKFFLKVDEGKTTNWIDISGSGGGLNGAVNLGLGAQVLKNILLGVLQLRSFTAGTNMVVTQNANDIQVAANANEITTPIELTTNSAVFETIWSHAIPINTAEKIGVKIVGRKADGSEHCLFERIGLFHNESGTATAQRLWQSQVTLKSDTTLDIRYQLVGGTINVQVKSLNADTFYWKGQVFQIALDTL